MAGGLTLKDVLVMGTDFLAKKGIETPRLDCEVLYAHALGLKRLDLYIKFDMPMEEKDLKPLRRVLARRVAGESVAYIVGKKAFYGLELEVGPGVLVPRPDTEVLVDEVLAFVRERPSARVLDLCAGSGAIGLAVAANAPEVTVIAVELYEKAAEFCRQNIARLKLETRVSCLLGDLYSPLQDMSDGFDVIVSNPPYVKDRDWDKLPVTVKGEPKEALLGGTDGMAVVRRIVDGAAQWLRSKGLLCIEIGYKEQAEALTEKLKNAGYSHIRVLKDLAGLPRAVCGQWG